MRGRPDEGVATAWCTAMATATPKTARAYRRRRAGEPTGGGVGTESKFAPAILANCGPDRPRRHRRRPQAGGWAGASWVIGAKTAGNAPLTLAGHGGVEVGEVCGCADHLRRRARQRWPRPPRNKNRARGSFNWRSKRRWVKRP